MHNWIFQANPDRYDIVSVLENNQPIDAWLIQRHADDVQPGDRAALWVGGRRSPGVYAVGTVTGTPGTAVVDDPWWQRSEDQDAPMLRCPVRFDNILLDAPITRSDLQADPRFEGSRILTQPFAGNPFLVTDDEWQAIADRLPSASTQGPTGTARKYDVDNPSPAAESFGRWLQNKTGLPVTAHEVMAHWFYGKDWEAERRTAGLPITNRTHSIDDPSEPARGYAAFLGERAVEVDPSRIQAMWKYHREWQSSPERREERKRRGRLTSTQAVDAVYFILNQREVRPGDDGYDDVEGQKYHWTSQSSGAWKRLSASPGARFVYYRPGTASDGTTRSYFGIGVVAEIQEPDTEGFVATIADFVRFDRPVPSAEGPEVVPGLVEVEVAVPRSRPAVW